MKKVNWLIVLLAVITLTACGSSGGGGGGDLEAEVEAAMEDFGDTLGDCMDSEANPCDCPGGGTITMNEAGDQMTANDCVSATGKTYSGVIDSPDSGATLNGTLTPFGDCSTATASGVGTDTCEGTFSVTCPAGTETCDVIDDPDAEGECTVDC